MKILSHEWKTTPREWERLNTVLRGWLSHKKYVGLKSNCPRRGSAGRGYPAKDCYDLVEGEIRAGKNPALYRKLLRGYVTLGSFQDRFLTASDKETRDKVCFKIWSTIRKTEGM